MTKGHALERVREEVLSVYKAAAALHIRHHQEPMKQLGQTGLRQRASSARVRCVGCHII